MTKKTLTAFVVVGTVALVAFVLLPRISSAQRGPRPGQHAPEIIGGPWVGSEPLTLERLRGRVIFVEFWTYG